MKRTLFLIVFALVAVDQVTKWLAEATLPFHEAVQVLPFFSLYLTHNIGVAFSMFSWVGSLGLIIATIAIIMLVLYLWRRVGPDKQLAHLGFALIVGGALGNLIDRILYGHVIDFFLFHTDRWAFAVFNVADSYITVGAICIVLDEIVTAIAEAREKKAGKADPGQT